MGKTSYRIDDIAARQPYEAPKVEVVDWQVSVTGMRGPDGEEVPPLKHRLSLVMIDRDGELRACAVRVMFPEKPPTDE